MPSSGLNSDHAGCPRAPGCGPPSTRIGGMQALALRAVSWAVGTEPCTLSRESTLCGIEHQSRKTPHTNIDKSRWCVWSTGITVEGKGDRQPFWAERPGAESRTSGKPLWLHVLVPCFKTRLGLCLDDDVEEWEAGTGSRRCAGQVG